MAERWRVIEQLLDRHVNPEGYRRFATVVFGQAFADGCTWDGNPANERLSIAERADRLGELPERLWTTLHREHGAAWEDLEKAGTEMGVSLPARPSPGVEQEHRDVPTGPVGGRTGVGTGQTGTSPLVWAGGGAALLVIGGVAWVAAHGTVGTDAPFVVQTHSAETHDSPPPVPPAVTTRTTRVTVLDWFGAEVQGTVTVAGSAEAVALEKGSATLTLPLADAAFTVEAADHHATWHGTAPMDLAAGRLVVPVPCRHAVKLPSAVKPGSGVANTLERGIAEDIGAACPVGAPAGVVVELGEPKKAVSGTTVTWRGTSSLALADDLAVGADVPAPLERPWSCTKDNTALLAGGEAVGFSSVVGCVGDQVGGEELGAAVAQLWGRFAATRGACDEGHPCSLVMP